MVPAPVQVAPVETDDVPAPPEKEVDVVPTISELVQDRKVALKIAQLAAELGQLNEAASAARKKQEAVSAQLKKLVGEVESSLSKDWLTIPEASPVEGDLSIVFEPTTQRVMAATFDAWPDDSTGRWAFFGDETAS